MVPWALRNRVEAPSSILIVESNQRSLTPSSTHHLLFHTQPRTPLTTPFLVEPNHKQSLALYAYTDNDESFDDRERIRVPRGGRGRRYEEQDDGRYYDEEEEDDDNYYDDEEEYEDEDEFDVDFEFDRVELDEEYAADILIPNPILDNIDPEGAGERFGEIARDPKFWFDVLVVMAVYNFLESVAHVPIY